MQADIEVFIGWVKINRLMGQTNYCSTVKGELDHPFSYMTGICDGEIPIMRQQEIEDRRSGNSLEA